MDKLDFTDFSPEITDSNVQFRRQLSDRIAVIGKTIAHPNADDVDRNSRFPHEAITALREAKALSAAVPTQFGGPGCSISELSSHCEELGQRCSSSAMILAMHHIQVASIARHAGESPYLLGYLRDIVDHQFLLASVTSEVGVGGDLRTSRTCVEAAGDMFLLNKSATTISYGAYADAFLVTARRSPECAPGDQSLVLVHKRDTTLEPTGTWDTLGMRGTCSPGFEVRSHGRREQIIPDPFAAIVTRTMVPYSHLLWSALWCGIARGALTKAAAFVRAAARKSPGMVPPAALRLAEVSAEFQMTYQNVRSVCRQYEMVDRSADAAETLSSFGFALQMNNLKITTSQQAARIVQSCLDICGVAGYRNDSPYSIGRPLRDALSAAIMIGNDRILATNASMLLVHKEI